MLLATDDAQTEPRIFDHVNIMGSPAEQNLFFQSMDANSISGAIIYLLFFSDDKDVNVFAPVLLIMSVQGNLLQGKIPLKKLQFRIAPK